MAGEKDDDQRDLTVREEHDGSAVIVYTDEPTPGGKPSAEGASGETQDTPTGAAEDDEGDETLTEAEAAGKTEAEREEIRERRRAERAHRKQVRKDREEMTTRQLESERQARMALEQRLQAIEQRNSGSELAQLDTAIKQAGEAYTFYKNQIAEAASKNDGATVANATEKLMQAHQRGVELVNVREAYTQRQATPPPLDPRLLSNAEKWLSDNKWYDVNGRDEDSRIMRVIDDGVQRDGFDPTTPAYWEELSKRAKNRFPHRYGNQTPKASDDKPRSHVTGNDRSSSQTTAGGRFEFKLSAARVNAIKEAGAWDDPVKRNKMIQNYRDYDAKHNQ